MYLVPRPTGRSIFFCHNVNYRLPTNGSSRPPLEELRQEHLDTWLADGPSTRRFVDRFIPRAIKTRLVGPDLTIARHRRGTSPKLSKAEQDAAVERVVHTDELTVRGRAAAIRVASPRGAVRPSTGPRGPLTPRSPRAGWRRFRC